MGDYYEMTLRGKEPGTEGHRLLIRVDTQKSVWGESKSVFATGDEDAQSRYTMARLIPTASKMLMNWTFDKPCSGKDKEWFLCRHASAISIVADLLQTNKPIGPAELYTAKSSGLRPLSTEEVIYWPKPAPPEG